MKLQGVWLCFSGLMSVALVGLIKLRRKDEAKEEKEVQFHFVKLRVTMDLLSEYQHKVIHAHSLMDKTRALLKDLETESSTLHGQQLVKKNEAEACSGDMKHLTDEEASATLYNAKLKAEFDKQKVKWEEELASLKQKAGQRSKVCDFVKDSAEARKMCEDKVFKKEAPKEEAPKEAAGTEDPQQGDQ